MHQMLQKILERVLLRYSQIDRAKGCGRGYSQIPLPTEQLDPYHILEEFGRQLGINTLQELQCLCNYLE